MTFFDGGGNSTATGAAAVVVVDNNNILPDDDDNASFSASSSGPVAVSNGGGGETTIRFDHHSRSNSQHRLRRTTKSTTKSTTTDPPKKEEELSADSYYRVPVFDVLELRGDSGDSGGGLSTVLSTTYQQQQRLRQVLADTGLLSISISHLPSALAIRNVRHTVFHHVICSCWRTAGGSSSSSSYYSSARTVSGGILADGTRRTTLATATIGTSPIPLDATTAANFIGGNSDDDDDSCRDPMMTALPALEALRDVVHGIAQEFIAAFDGLLLQQPQQEQQPSPQSRSTNGTGSSSSSTGTATGTALLHTSRGRSYYTLHDIVQASHHLEHFHLYEKPNDDDNDDDNNGRRGGGNNNDNDDQAFSATETVLPIHTDAGLFLVFVPGMECDGHDHNNKDDDDDDNNVSSSSLYVERQSGLVQRAIFAPDTFGVLMGAGAEHWLNNIQYRLPIRATRHAVRMRNGTARAWYGMMHLVPQDAILQDLPQRTFADLRQSLVHSKDRKYGVGGNAGSEQEQEEEAFAAIGCGPAPVAADISGNNTMTSSSSSSLLPRVARRRRLQMVDDASACDNVTNFFCWMSCLPIPDPPSLSSSSSASSSTSSLVSSSLYCLDPRTLDATSGNVTAAVRECTGVNGQPGALHNDICTGLWHTSVSDLPEAATVKENLLLEGDDNAGNDPAPTTQFCYGGTSMYMDGFHWLGNTCVIYLFPEWIVTTSQALVGACFGTFFVAMALEGIIRLRRYAVAALPTGTWRRLLVSATFYGLQLTMGYLIMLIVMTYSGPLFLSVILGLMGGHVVFNADQARSDDTAVNNKRAAATTTQKEAMATTTKLSSHGSMDDEHKQPEEPSSCCGGPSATEEGENQPKTTTTRGNDLVPEGCTPCCQNTL